MDGEDPPIALDLCTSVSLLILVLPVTHVHRALSNSITLPPGINVVHTWDREDSLIFIIFSVRQRHGASWDIEGLQVALEKELLSDEEPRSLAEVAKSLGYPVRTLMKFFPSLCQKIIVRGQVHRKMHNELRKQKIQDEVKRVMLIIHAEQEYPSLAQVLKLIDRSCVCPPLFYLEAYVPWKKILEVLGYRG